MKQKRLYSLYQVIKTADGRKRYESASDMAFEKEVAVRVFQNALIASAFSGQPMELRPLKGTEKIRLVGKEV